MEKRLLDEMLDAIQTGEIFSFIESNSSKFSRSDLEKTLLEFVYACTDSNGNVFDATRTSLMDYLKDNLIDKTPAPVAEPTTGVGDNTVSEPQPVKNNDQEIG